MPLTGILLGVDDSVDFHEHRRRRTSAGRHRQFQVAVDRMARSIAVGFGVGQFWPSIRCGWLTSRFFIDDRQFLAHDAFGRRAIDELVAKRGAECQE